MQNHIKGLKLYITGQAKAPAKEDNKYEEYESHIGKINSQITNSADRITGKQLSKFTAIEPLDNNYLNLSSEMMPRTTSQAVHAKLLK